MKNIIELQKTTRRYARRRAFTLVEMIIVIVIILLISILVLPSLFDSFNDRKYSDSVRTLQAVFLGARDRAIQSGNVVGLRLIREETDPFEVTRLIYVTVPVPFSVGRVNVSAMTVTPDLKGPDGMLGTADDWPDPHFEQVDPGKDTTLNTVDDIRRIVSGQSSIRFDFSGKLYLISSTPSGSPASFTISPVPVAVAAFPAVHQYQIFGAPGPMPQADAMLLPEGVAIDVRRAPMPYQSPYSADQTLTIPRSRGIPNAAPPNQYLGADQTLGTSDDLPAATWPPMDILFAPNGQVTGTAAQQPLIHFWIGERGDKGPDPVVSRGTDNIARTADDRGPNRRRLLVTLNTRTGTLQILNEPGTASVDNWPPMITTDDYADIYAPAEQSLGVSILP